MPVTMEIPRHSPKPLNTFVFHDSQDNEISVQYVKISPELAAELLRDNIENNRPISRANLDRLALDMRDGVFLFNGDTIKFDQHGHLVDGQHRLQAVVDSGTAQFFLVITGLSAEAMTTMDQGNVRTIDNILRISGRKVKNANTVIATQQILTAGDLDSFQLVGNRARMAEVVWENVASLEPWAEWAKRLTSDSNLYISATHLAGRGVKQKRAVSQAPLCALAVLMVNNNASVDNVSKFFEAVITGMVTDPSLNEVTRVVRRWLSTTNPLIRDSGTNLLAMFKTYDTIIRQYNRWLSGETVERVVPGRGDTGIRWIADITAPVG